MSNPYEPPVYQPNKFGDLPAYVPQVDTGYGWVSQVRIVAILNCVQGGLEIPMGLMHFGIAFFFPAMLHMDRAANRGQRPAGEPPEAFIWLMFAGTLLLGIAMLVGSGLRIYSGLKNFHFRGRTLGIVSFIVGMVSVLSCYCAPTGIAVLIYGLIVYLNPAVTAAFMMGEQGTPGDTVLASFAPYRPMPMQPMPPHSPTPPPSDFPPPGT